MSITEISQSFISQIQLTDSALTEYHYNVASKTNALAEQLQKIQNLYKTGISRNCNFNWIYRNLKYFCNCFLVIDSEFFEPIEITLKAMTDGHNQIGNAIDLLSQRLEQLKRYYKKPKQGTLLFIRKI